MPSSANRWPLPCSCCPGAWLTAADVRNWLHERMAGYKVPKVVTFHDQLPREDTGKIFKRKLREPYWEGRARRV
jgi:long-chain acyl-CoA synthetase